MNFSIQKIILLIALTLIIACSTKQELFVESSNPQIKYSGRINSVIDEGVELYWPGSSIKLNFEGESISAQFKDEKGKNYYNIIIDNDSPFIFHPDTIKQFHQLASGLSKGKHSIEIFKRTEWDKGKTSFYGFNIEGNAKILPKPIPHKRKIEFYGNSISAGYAVEDLSGGDSPDSTYTNNYLSYAAITARHFKSEYNCICRGGIGVAISWYPLTMPQMYDRLIPSEATSKWDFSLYNPDLVVINLFQNDSWIVIKPDLEIYKSTFRSEAPDDDFFINAYQQFVSNIRNKYPNADIICALGSMDASIEGSKWVNYINEAVNNLNDEKMYTHFFPYKNTPGHPSIKEQEEMAKSLIQFIDENIDW